MSTTLDDTHLTERGGRLVPGQLGSRRIAPKQVPLDYGPEKFSVRIYVLGRFNVEHRDAELLPRSHKAPHKPLELLKALVAFGGREVSDETLAHALWPDAEGDRALVSLDVTVHRLRRFLRLPGVLALYDRKLTLDAHHCWVDCWAFEWLMQRADAALQLGDAGEVEIADLSTQIESLYQGAFLGSDTPTPWSLSLREQLRSRYLCYITDVGRYWERTGQHERAVACYLKGLEVDNLMEELYQKLMQCHLKRGERAETLATYYRCERVLTKLLGVRPCATTESLRMRAQTSV